jgi:WD40 repeat protein
MKVVNSIVVLLIVSVFVFAADDDEILKLESKIGFIKGEDKIVQYNLLENKKILLIGEKNLQIWDVENAKLVNSVPHQIPQFAPRGFFSTYILLSIPQILDLWKPYVVDPNGKFIITAEKIGDNKLQSAVVRDLQTLKQIAVLDLPNVSTEFVALDERNNEIRTFGQTDKTGAFADWDADDFQLKKLISVDEYKWHHLIKNEAKVIVGSGDTKFLWSDFSIKQGDRLTLRDVKTGKVEKEFTAQNLIPRTTFQETTLSKDEKFLLAKRDERIFVWEIDGDGMPRFEVSAKSEKEDYDFVKIIGGRFFAVSVDKKLHVYDIAGNGTPQFVLASDTPNDSVQMFDQTKDGKYIAVADDAKISVLETAGDGKPLYEIVSENKNERFALIKFLEDKNSLAVGRVNRSDKKQPRTEFYDIETGKLTLEIPVVFSFNVKVTPDGNFLYDEELGGTGIWNFAKKSFFFISLKIYETEYKPDAIVPQTPPYNIEHTSLSPNGKLILKYGDDVVSVYDIETGKEVQKLFDAERVKYNKKNEIKKSGLGNVFWSEDSTGVYALDEKSKTVSFWKVSK